MTYKLFPAYAFLGVKLITKIRIKNLENLSRQFSISRYRIIDIENSIFIGKVINATAAFIYSIFWHKINTALSFRSVSLPQCEPRQCQRGELSQH